MRRALLAMAMLGSLVRTSDAGWKCEKLPNIVFFSRHADVHEDGKWHRGVRGEKTERTGRLSNKALEKFVAFKDSKASDAKVIACLDALIASENGKAAMKACRVPSRA